MCWTFFSLLFGLCYGYSPLDLVYALVCASYRVDMRCYAADRWLTLHICAWCSMCLISSHSNTAHNQKPKRATQHQAAFIRTSMRIREKKQIRFIPYMPCDRHCVWTNASEASQTKTLHFLRRIKQNTAKHEVELHSLRQCVHSRKDWNRDVQQFISLLIDCETVCTYSGLRFTHSHWLNSHWSLSYPKDGNKFIKTTN